MQLVHAQLARRRGMADTTLNFGVNKNRFVVGEAPYFTITGALPGAKVLWSSTRNGQPTGENQADYGHSIDANGVMAGSGGAFESNQTGSWTKTVNIADQTATVAFDVVPAIASTPVATLPYYPVQNQQLVTNADLVDLFGYQIPKAVLWAGVGILAYLFLTKKR